MFAGIGDARNLWQTLLHISEDARNGKLDGELFHITIVDIQPAALARDLVVLLLLDRIGSDSRGSDIFLACLYYTYLAPLMPPRLYGVLQDHIQQAVDMLEGRHSLPLYLDVPQVYRAGILTILKAWQHNASAKFPASRMRKEIVQQRKRDEMDGLSHKPVTEWKDEQSFYEQTGVLPMTKPHDEFYEERIRGTLDDSPADQAKLKAVVSIVNTEWATNVTFVDPEWLISPMNGADIEVDFPSDPWRFATSLMESGTSETPGRRLMEHVNQWFTDVAAAIAQLERCVKIEFCVGDITSVLEQVRYGIVGYRHQENAAIARPVQSYNTRTDMTVNSEGALDRELPSSNERDNEAPRVYDRIHLSNIPDYIGGSLTSFLYAIPVTQLGDSSYITSTCLRNPPRFKSPAHYHSEYIGLTDPSDLATTFRVSTSGARETSILDSFGISMFPMCKYRLWHHLPKASSLAELMPRDRLTTWLYRFFLKVAIPMYKEDPVSISLIYSPLNITAFLRVVCHLHDVGCPAHWLNDIISCLLQGKIRSGARPPRSDPLEPQETKAKMPALEQSVAPFTAELSTLTSMWQFALPFGLTTSSIPTVDMIRRYQVKFDVVGDAADSAATMPSFVLAFFSEMHFVRQESLRSILLSDEKADSTAQGKKMREEGLHILTTWSWAKGERMASFWLRKDVMDRMLQQKRWKVGIWRTDCWRHQCQPVGIGRVVDTGETWSSFK